MSDGEHSRSRPLSSEASARAEVRDLVLGRPGIEDFLCDLAALAADIEPGAHCSVVLDRDPQPLTVAATDTVAASLDEVQHLHGDGPALLALRTGLQVEYPPPAEDHRWTEFARCAETFDVRSAVCLPLIVEGDPIGVLSLYSSGSGARAETEVQRAQLIAAEAAAGLSMVLRRSRFVPDDQLFRALATRRLIDQALGILMHADQVSSRAALETLLDLAHTSNRSLGAVATEVIESTAGERGPADGVTGE
jgi:GAF domain-containing protein